MADRGYVLLWRKFWDSQLFKTSQPFSEREAWLYLFSNLANGIDRNGVGRGEFNVSIRYLAKAWGWSKTKVDRFLAKLEANSMIARVGQQTGQQTGQFCGHFTVCNYETYQKPWDSKRDTKRDSKRDKSNEGLNESKKKERYRATSLPPEFALTDEMKAWAKDHCPDVDLQAETAHFIDHHTAKGSTFKDWTAAWRTWMRRSKSWGKPAQRPTQAPIDQSEFFDTGKTYGHKPKF